jgi:Ca-activated chloride channel family protein
MNRIHSITFTVAILIGCLGMSESSRAQDTVQRFNAANRAMQDGNVDEALVQYNEIEPLLPGNHQLAYNKGVALYRKGELDSAQQLFANALNTENAELAASASFNLGNCQYAKAVLQVESDPNSAIQSLDNAIAHYRSALQTNPSDRDARANIELANQLLKKLKQEQEQQQQEQEQEQQDQQDQQQETT